MKFCQLQRPALLALIFSTLLSSLLTADPPHLQQCKICNYTSHSSTDFFCESCVDSLEPDPIKAQAFNCTDCNNFPQPRTSLQLDPFRQTFLTACKECYSKQTLEAYVDCYGCGKTAANFNPSKQLRCHRCKSPYIGLFIGTCTSCQGDKDEGFTCKLCRGPVSWVDCWNCTSKGNLLDGNCFTCRSSLPGVEVNGTECSHCDLAHKLFPTCRKCKEDEPLYLVERARILSFRLLAFLLLLATLAW